ncbi:MAG: CHAT domain-containing protein [Calothrix sp. SM1_7_51]|nr:CHAT domain-containing protein [Calothrix sp. SM1_7_51]
MRILFLTADPTDKQRLRLQLELREIKNQLRVSYERDKFQLEFGFSARYEDVSQEILNFRPHIVHFSGHGMNTGELCLEGEWGDSQPIAPEDLAELFELAGETVECVLLNACYSEAQATAIAQHIPFVIGMNKAISDDAAVAFAIGFYKALGANFSIEKAFKFGRQEVKRHKKSEELTPTIYKKDNNIIKSNLSQTKIIGIKILEVNFNNILNQLKASKINYKLVFSLLLTIIVGGYIAKSVILKSQTQIPAIYIKVK